MKVSEVLTVLSAGVSVVAVSVTSTLYLGRADSGELELAAESVRRAYDISDAYFPCRDQISRAIPYHVRNINIDSRSSHYDERDNNHVVFVGVEVMDSGPSVYRQSYDAQIVCRVSAANNEISSFKVKKA